MADVGVDCLILAAGSDQTYLTGYRAVPTERPTLLVVPEDADREPVLLVPTLEAPRVGPVPVRVEAWDETDDPIGLATKIAGRPTVAAVSDDMWARFLLDFLAHLTDTTFVPASRVMRPLRSRKDSDEVRALARAAEAVDRVIARVPTEVRFAGRREREVAARIRELTVAEGHDEASFCIVASGPNSASPHHEPSDREIRPGDLVVIDFGGRIAGYCSDVTRSFVVGEPTPEYVEVHRVVAEAQAAAKEAARVGIPAQEVDRAARKVIDRAGYGPHFVHRVGHGIGLDVHEHPYLVEGNTEPLEVGMSFSIEPGIYLPGRFGVRIEDICVVTSDGLEVLNQADRDLVSVD
jgi:Xaa-Pro aminopeptidase